VQPDPAAELILRDVVGQAAQVELAGVVRLLAALGHHAGALLLRRERLADVLFAGDLRERGNSEQRQQQPDASLHGTSLYEEPCANLNAPLKGNSSSVQARFRGMAYSIPQLSGGPPCPH